MTYPSPVEWHAPEPELRQRILEPISGIQTYATFNPTQWRVYLLPVAHLSESVTIDGIYYHCSGAAGNVILGLYGQGTVVGDSPQGAPLLGVTATPVVVAARNLVLLTAAADLVIDSGVEIPGWLAVKFDNAGATINGAWAITLSDVAPCYYVFAGNAALTLQSPCPAPTIWGYLDGNFPALEARVSAII